MKTLRGGNGRRSTHDEARPWGGLGFDVKSNTYASEPGPVVDVGGGVGVDEAIATAAGGAKGLLGARRSSLGATPRKGPAESSPGGRRTRGEGFIERLLGTRVSTPNR